MFSMLNGILLQAYVTTISFVVAETPKVFLILRAKPLIKKSHSINKVLFL